VNQGKHIEQGWPKTAYQTSKVALTALTRIQQRDARDNILINAVHPGFVDTDMTNHKGHLTPDQGADAPAYYAMIPTDATEPRGAMIWFDRKIVDWIND
jgi:carbonyl reductase 1